MAGLPVLIDYTKLSWVQKVVFTFIMMATYYVLLFAIVAVAFGFYETHFDPDPYEGVLDGARVLVYFFWGNIVLFSALFFPILRLFRVTKKFICAAALLSYPIIVGIFGGIFALRLIVR
jgi:hypothetical protein